MTRPLENPLLTWFDSLTEVADLFQPPTATPPPPITQFRQLLDQRIDQLESEFQQRDPSASDIETHRAAYQKSRARLWNKILELNDAHRKTVGLNLPTDITFSTPSASVAIRDPFPSNPPACALSSELNPSIDLNPLPDDPLLDEPAPPREDTQPVPDHNEDEGLDFYQLSPSFEHDPSDPAIANRYKSDDEIEICESHQACAISAFGPRNMPEARASYLIQKYIDPSFDLEPVDDVDFQSHQSAANPPHASPATPGLPPANPGQAAANPGQLVTLRARPADYSPLDDVSYADQAKIISFLKRGFSPERVAKLISTPPPKGLGIPTSRASVRRFKTRFLRREKAELRSSAHEDAQQIAADLAAQKQFIPATVHLLQAQLFETVQSQESVPLPDFNHIVLNLARLAKIKTSSNDESPCSSRREEAGSPPNKT